MYVGFKLIVVFMLNEFYNIFIGIYVYTYFLNVWDENFESSLFILMIYEIFFIWFVKVKFIF